MAELPFFPLYVSDFGDGTKHLDPTEVGIYTRLLCLCWSSPGCSFPNDIVLIRRKTLTGSKQFDGMVESIIDEFFSVKRGRIYQKRLLLEYEKAKTKFKKLSDAGKKGGAAKSLKTHKKRSSDDKAMNDHRLSDEQAVRFTSTITNTIIELPLTPKSCFDYWNQLTEKSGLPKASKLTKDRDNKLKARISDHGADIFIGIENIHTSSFCNGSNDRGWRANFDFLLKPGSLNKAIEGAYKKNDGPHYEPFDLD